MIHEEDIGRVVRELSHPPTEGQIDAVRAWGADALSGIAYDPRPLARLDGRNDYDGLAAWIGAVAGAVNSAEVIDRDQRDRLWRLYLHLQTLGLSEPEGNAEILGDVAEDVAEGARKLLPSLPAVGLALGMALGMALLLGALGRR